MRINLLYFASVREAIGSGSETLVLDDSDSENAPTIATLCDALRAHHPAWDTLFAGNKPIKFAVNQEFATHSTPLSEDCEVAVFPPVTGG